MADEDEKMKHGWIIHTIQTLGVSTAFCLGLAWFAVQTINWEREQMIPTIQKSNTAIEGSNAVLKSVDETLKDLKRHLDRMSKNGG